jgi:hypothetical protein
MMYFATLKENFENGVALSVHQKLPSPLLIDAFFIKTRPPPTEPGGEKANSFLHVSL